MPHDRDVELTEIRIELEDFRREIEETERLVEQLNTAETAAYYRRALARLEQQKARFRALVERLDRMQPIN